MNFIFDACTLIAFLRGEIGAEVIETLLLDPNNIYMVHAVNLCEVYYDFLRVSNEQVAQTAIADLAIAGLIIREDMDITFWQEAGKLKAGHRLSLADCFAIALTQRVQGELVTSDHHEFEPIAANSICPIRFFR